MISTLVILLVTAAMAAAAAAIGALWRRVDLLTTEVARLREAAEPRAVVAVAEAWRSSTVHAPEMPPEPALEAEVPAQLWPEGASNDPFDDSWVIRREPALRTAPLPEPRPRPSAAPPPAPLLGAPPSRRPPAPVLDSPPWVLIAAVFAMTAPAALLLLEAPAVAVWTVGGLATALVLAFARRTARPRLVWAAAVAACGWSVWAGLAVSPVWCAVGFVFLGGVALGDALSYREARPDGLVLGVLTAVSFAIAHSAPMLFAVAGAIIAGAALVGAARQRLEWLHVAAWFAGCAALFLIGGMAAAQIWFAPAAAWAGAWFLGLAAVRAPALGRQGAVVAATGASAPILAVMSLHLAGRDLSTPVEAAAALVCIALALGAVLTTTARRAGGLAELGIAVIPLGVGVAGAIALALLVAMTAPFAAAGLSIAALAALYLDRRWPHVLWRALGLCLMFGAAAASLGAFAMLASGVTGWLALLAIATGFLIPAVLALRGAHVAAARAPISSAAFELLGYGGAAVTMAAFIRWAGAGGAPAFAPIDFAEGGLYAAGFGGLSLMLSLRGRPLIARAFATVLAILACAILIAGPLGALNPAWGYWPVRVLGFPLLNMLLLGFLLPALAAGAHFLLWRAQRRKARALIALALASASTLAWAMLETRRAFQGQDLTMAPPGAAEIIAYVVVLALLGMAATLARTLLRTHTTVSSSMIEGGPERQAMSLGNAARK